MTNNIDIFYQSIQEDIENEQLKNLEEGGFRQQLFTQYVINQLIEADEAENARIRYSECETPRNRHKINGYAFSENYESLDLFITIYRSVIPVVRITRQDIEDAVYLATNFFKKAFKGNLLKDLDETTEIYDVAHTIEKSKAFRENLERVNVIIITDGLCKDITLADEKIFEIPFFFRIVDMEYLMNITQKPHQPVIVDCLSDNLFVPCIKTLGENSDYEAYLAVIPGQLLANIYEKYGSRLLEKNVRTFLQFTGNINKGIRRTIQEEPHMFLAYNNGISATADQVTFSSNGDNGHYIREISDFQIVNGGQTTASIYHTWKKEKIDISNIFVQLKLSVIKNKEKAYEIVSSISEYANTQNKVSLSDLSSNTPFHIQIEKLSRQIWLSPVKGQTRQTRWFYERVRGQYKNERNAEGTPSKIFAFDKRNPRSQLFTKEELAKYLNVFSEIYDEEKKFLIDPNTVVKGSQKNYAHFINYNIPEIADEAFYRELIAKAIIFRNAEKIYGVKPNSIGDMRYITVPYTLAWLSLRHSEIFNFNQIWKTQAISESLSITLYEVMVKMENFIKTNAPGSLYGEWAKKEQCWEKVKKIDFI